MLAEHECLCGWVGAGLHLTSNSAIHAGHQETKLVALRLPHGEKNTQIKSWSLLLRGLLAP